MWGKELSVFLDVFFKKSSKFSAPDIEKGDGIYSQYFFDARSHGFYNAR